MVIISFDTLPNHLAFRGPVIYENNLLWRLGIDPGQRVLRRYPSVASEACNILKHDMSGA